MSKEIISFDAAVKPSLDELFDRKPNMTVEDVTNLFKTKWTYVNECVGSVPEGCYTGYADVMEFSNIRNPELKEISRKRVPRKIIKNMGMKLFKPRYYGIKDDEIGYHKPGSVLTLICQPDRRKNFFITLTRNTNSWGNILVLTPWKTVIGY